MLLKKYWLLELSIFLVSCLSLMAIGAYWLWLQQWLWIWLGFYLSIIGIVFLMTSGANAWAEQRKKARQKNSLPDLAIKQANNDLRAIAENIKDSDPDLNDIAFYFNTLYRVVQTVAGRFYPEQKNAYLEINIPYLLKVAELIAHELRLIFLNNVPGSHMISLAQIVSAQNYAGKGMRLYGFIRKVALGTTLDSALLFNIKDSSKIELRDWLIDLYVQKIGLCAIEIYSGQHKPDEHLKKGDAESPPPGVARVKSAIAEPLRILVLGQTGSGKTSLINALFGKAVAEADVIPNTKGVTAYLLRSPEWEETIILDSEGYGGDSENLLADASEQLLKTDMMLLLISASNPARDNDHRVIRFIEAAFAAANKPKPPLVVALTHIDQLRPWREWQPPYNIAEPDTAKAGNIRAAMLLTAQQLSVGLDHIAPVCIKSGREYNLEEGLIPTLLQHLDRAKQLRYLRCVARYRDEDYWRRLWRQSKNAGRFIANEAYKLTR